MHTILVDHGAFFSVSDQTREEYKENLLRLVTFQLNMHSFQDSMVNVFAVEFHTYRQPFFVLLNKPSIINEIQIPNVINNWVTVTKQPRILAGAASEIYIGTVADA